MADEMRAEYDLAGTGVRGRYFYEYWRTMPLFTWSPTTGTWSNGDRLFEPTGLPPGSQASWKRGIWG